MHKAKLVTVLEGAGDVAHLLVSCGSVKTGPSRGMGPVTRRPQGCFAAQLVPASPSHLWARTHVQGCVLQHFSIFNALLKIFLARGQKVRHSYKIVIKPE